MFLYTSAVIKHGSHNQKTHAGSRGGGGAGSQSQSGGPLEDAKDAAKDAVAAVNNMISGAKDSLKRTQSKVSDTPFFNAVIERHKGTIKGYQDAQRLIGKPKELAKLKSTMNRAKKDVKLPSTSGLDRAFVEGYADAAIQVATMYGDIDVTI